MEQVLFNNMLSVVIPAYNEEDGILDIVRRVLAVRPALRAEGTDLELIVVDDGSRDQTASKVCECSGVRLVSHTRNKGYGAAIKTGFHAAQGDLLAFLDADGTYPPEHFPELCRAAINGADMVVGSRRSGASSEMPFLRRVGNFLWSNLLTLIAARPVIDPASGMRVVRRDALQKLYPLPDGLNFTPVMSTRAAHEDLKMVEVAIPYKERVGRSKLNVVRDGLRFLNTILWTAMYYNPLRIFGGIGALLGGVALALFAVLVGMRIAGITELGPLGIGMVYSMVTLAFAGLDLFALGSIFNYLVSLFHPGPVRQGLLGHPMFHSPFYRNFSWMGALLVAGGLGMGFTCLGLGLNGWAVARLWLYLLAATMLVLVGMQLMFFFLLMRVLDELRKREALVEKDLECE